MTETLARHAALTSPSNGRKRGCRAALLAILAPAGAFLSNPPPMATEHINVSYVAALARLELSAEECEVFQRQLDAILGHAESLAALDVTGIEPTSYPAPVYDVMREDEPRPSLPQEAVLANAPDQAQEQIRVPKVIADA